jgi:hypothetical protein
MRPGNPKQANQGDENVRQRNALAKFKSPLDMFFAEKHTLEEIK